MRHLYPDFHINPFTKRNIAVKTVYFVSSYGDTALAMAVINAFEKQGNKTPAFLIALTAVAEQRVRDLPSSSTLHQVGSQELLGQSEIPRNRKMRQSELEKIQKFLNQNQIKRAYIGVPSSEKETNAFEIAQFIKIPTILAYEFMFSAPEKHSFWEYLPQLARKKDLSLAVPLKAAVEDLKAHGADTVALQQPGKVHIIGHLSIDKALRPDSIDIHSEKISRTKAALSIQESEDFIFISGTSRSDGTDKNFLEILLRALETQKNLRLRWGIHPGVPYLDTYLRSLLATCQQYPFAQEQFKIIVTNQIQEKLTTCIPPEDESFIVHAEISGTDAGAAAVKVAQAVPGALLNTAVIGGKPAYFNPESTNQSVRSYLPTSLFAANPDLFFQAPPHPPLTYQTIGLGENATTTGEALCQILGALTMDSHTSWFFVSYLPSFVRTWINALLEFCEKNHDHSITASSDANAMHRPA